MNTMISYFFNSLDVCSCCHIDLYNFEHSRKCEEDATILIEMRLLVDSPCEFFSGMMVVKFFYAVYIGSLMIIVTREGIHKGIDFSDFWNVMSDEIPFCRSRSDKEGSILEKKSEHTILTHRTVSDISVSNIHRILGKNSISNRESDFLITYQEPGMMPQIVLISEEDYEKYEKSYYTHHNGIHHKIEDECQGKDSDEKEFQ